MSSQIKSIRLLFVLTGLFFSPTILHSQSTDENYDELYSTALEMILRDKKGVENFQESFCIPDSIFNRKLFLFNDLILNSSYYLEIYFEENYIKSVLEDKFFDSTFIYQMSDSLFPQYHNCSDIDYLILFGPTDGNFLQVFVQKKEYGLFSMKYDVFLFIFSDKRLIHFFKGIIVE